MATLVLNYNSYSNKLEVNGDTYPVKEKLKKMGFDWDSEKKVWYTYVTDMYCGDLYNVVKKLSEIASVEFSKDSDVKSIDETISNEAKCTEEVSEVISRFFGDMQYNVVKGRAGIIDVVKECWTKESSKHFEAYRSSCFKSTFDSMYRTFHVVYDKVKDVTYVVRDTSRYYITPPREWNGRLGYFLSELDKESLNEKEASDRLQDFIEREFMPIERAEEMIERLNEHREEKFSAVPYDERVRQLKELFENLSDGEAYLLPESKKQRFLAQDILKDKPYTTIDYKHVELFKHGTRYIMLVHTLYSDTERMDHTVYMLRDDNRKVEEFLKEEDTRPVSVVAEEIEKYLRENFNFKEFEYEMNPYINIEIVINDSVPIDDVPEHVTAIRVTGYTELIKDVLQEQGFAKREGDSENAWVKSYRGGATEEEAEKDVEELVKKIPKELLRDVSYKMPFLDRLIKGASL